MLKERMSLVERVTPLFRTAEASTDIAAADAALCLAGMLRGRVESGLPIGVGAELIGKMRDAFDAAITARTLMLEAHRMTPETMRHMGLERMFGDGSPCPPTDKAFLTDTVVPITATR